MQPLPFYPTLGVSRQHPLWSSPDTIQEMRQSFEKNLGKFDPSELDLISRSTYERLSDVEKAKSFEGLNFAPTTLDSFIEKCSNHDDAKIRNWSCYFILLKYTYLNLELDYLEYKEVIEELPPNMALSFLSAIKKVARSDQIHHLLAFAIKNPETVEFVLAYKEFWNKSILQQLIKSHVKTFGLVYTMCEQGITYKELHNDLTRLLLKSFQALDSKKQQSYASITLNVILDLTSDLNIEKDLIELHRLCGEKKFDERLYKYNLSELLPPDEQFDWYLHQQNVEKLCDLAQSNNQKYAARTVIEKFAETASNEALIAFIKKGKFIRLYKGSNYGVSHLYQLVEKRKLPQLQEENINFLFDNSNSVCVRFKVLSDIQGTYAKALNLLLKTYKSLNSETKKSMADKALNIALDLIDRNNNPLEERVITSQLMQMQRWVSDSYDKRLLKLSEKGYDITKVLNKDEHFNWNKNLYLQLGDNSVIEKIVQLAQSDHQKSEARGMIESFIKTGPREHVITFVLKKSFTHLFSSDHLLHLHQVIKTRALETTPVQMQMIEKSLGYLLEAMSGYVCLKEILDLFGHGKVCGTIVDKIRNYTERLMNSNFKNYTLANQLLFKSIEQSKPVCLFSEKHCLILLDSIRDFNTVFKLYQQIRQLGWYKNSEFNAKLQSILYDKVKDKDHLRVLAQSFVAKTDPQLFSNVMGRLLHWRMHPEVYALLQIQKPILGEDWKEFIQWVYKEKGIDELIKCDNILKNHTDSIKLLIDSGNVEHLSKFLKRPDLTLQKSDRILWAQFLENGLEKFSKSNILFLLKYVDATPSLIEKCAKKIGSCAEFLPLLTNESVEIWKVAIKDALNRNISLLPYVEKIPGALKQANLQEQSAIFLPILNKLIQANEINQALEFREKFLADFAEVIAKNSDLQLLAILTSKQSAEAVRVLSNIVKATPNAPVLPYIEKLISSKSLSNTHKIELIEIVMNAGVVEFNPFNHIKKFIHLDFQYFSTALETAIVSTTICLERKNQIATFFFWLENYIDDKTALLALKMFRHENFGTLFSAGQIVGFQYRLSMRLKDMPVEFSRLGSHAEAKDIFTAINFALLSDEIAKEVLGNDISIQAAVSTITHLLIPYMRKTKDYRLYPYLFKLYTVIIETYDNDQLPIESLAYHLRDYTFCFVNDDEEKLKKHYKSCQALLAICLKQMFIHFALNPEDPSFSNVVKSFSWLALYIRQEPCTLLSRYQGYLETKPAIEEIIRMCGNDPYTHPQTFSLIAKYADFDSVDDCKWFKNAILTLANSPREFKSRLFAYYHLTTRLGEYSERMISTSPYIYVHLCKSFFDLFDNILDMSRLRTPVENDLIKLCEINNQHMAELKGLCPQ